MYIAGERNKPEKNVNEIKPPLDLLSYRSNILTWPHFWQLSGGGGGVWTPPPSPWIRACTCIWYHTSYLYIIYQCLCHVVIRLYYHVSGFQYTWPLRSSSCWINSRDMNPWLAVLPGYFLGDLWHYYIELIINNSPKKNIHKELNYFSVGELVIFNWFEY